MSYHYRRGVSFESSWPQFIARLIICDMVFILLLLFGLKIYHNYMAQHDVQTIKACCQTVLCVRIDPNTGIGTPAVPELVPTDNVPRHDDIKTQEI